jgi:ubiquinone/menaquinone biosynthesis C-methylase UbiE
MATPNVGVYDDSPEQYDAFQTQFFEHGSPAVGAAYQGMFGALGLTPDQRVLEVGVGTGLNLRHYPPGTKVVGLDRSEAMLSVARGRMSDVVANVELVCTDAEKMPFEEASFDVVVCTFVLCSCKNPSQLVSEMARVCKPGGRIGLFDFHKAKTNQDLLADQFLLRETLLAGLLSQGRPVAVCDTFYDLDEHLPTGKVEIVFDRHLEASFSQAFRATALSRLG